MFSTRTTMTALAATALLTLTLGFSAQAEDTMQGMDHSKMNMQMGMDMGTPKGDQGPASTAYAKANATMHQGMDIEFTGDADLDFVRGMIAHHQGAIDMAKVQLEYGKDPEIRKLSEGVIAAQTAEIKQMEDWLAKHAE